MKFLKTGLVYSIVVFIFSCASKNEKTNGTVQPKLLDTTAAAVAVLEVATTATPYLNQLEYGDIKFTITSPQSPNSNSFTVAPSGFTMSNDTSMIECEGTIVHSEVWDMDSDNAPELLVVSKNGDDSKMKAYLFSANKNKSMSQVSIPDLLLNPKKSAGYSGHDEFAFVENSFVHRFPLYENGTLKNKTRQFQYKLKPGEAMKQLVLYNTVEY